MTSSATGIRFSAILFPPRSSALLTVGLPATKQHGRTSTGLPRSAHTRHDRIGCLLTPGTTVLTPGSERLPGRCLPLHGGDVPGPRSSDSICPRFRLTRHQRGFRPFTRPVFPSPVASRMEREPLGFSLSFAPCRPEPGNARQGRRQALSTGLEHALSHRLSLQFNMSTRDVRPRVARRSPTARAYRRGLQLLWFSSGRPGAALAGAVRRQLDRRWLVCREGECDRRAGTVSSMPAAA